MSYLFDGEIVHRDSLGTLATIKPGDVNWMKAGRGIAHSERTDEKRRGGGEHLHGLQCWNALPIAHEESAPDFIHHAVDELPVITGERKTVRLIAGAAYGAQAPLKTTWDTLFADATLAPGARLPVDADYEERAIYVVAGEVDIAGDRFGPGQLLVLRSGDRIAVDAVGDARVVLVGGAPMDGPRHIWWNFVSSRKERIEEAKADWKAGRFARVAGETEFIPLPE